MRILAFLLLLVGVSGAADLEKYDTADKLWDYFDKLEHAPIPEAASMEQIRAVMFPYWVEWEAAAIQFRTLYPHDSRRWELQRVLVQIQEMRARLSGKRLDLPALRPSLEEMVVATNASERVRNYSKLTLIRVYAEAATEESTRALHKLAMDPHPQIAQAATSELTRLPLRKQPLELSFTAVDGRKVDLAALRGKVVLLDFWATWCGPCRMETPNHIAAYKKFHEKGFEIVGISLDEEKEALLEYVKKEALPWPHHFDGAGFNGAVSRRFGVDRLPTTWLLDKKGFIRWTEARGDIAEEVEKLLAE